MQPTPYTPQADYSLDIIPGNVGNALDIDFNDIALSVGEICTNLALIQKDDGGLSNGIVTPFTLSVETIAMLGDWTIRGAWVTATLYSPLDLVSNGGINYLCLIQHVSGTFATDLAAGKWMAMSKTDSLSSAFSLTLLPLTTAAAWLTAIGGQPIDADLTAIAALTSAADKLPYATGAQAWALTSFTAFARTLLDDADAPTARQTLILDKSGADVASAPTINLTTTTGDYVDVTGTTTITAITLADGVEKTVRFTGILTLTNGASLVLPGAANVTTAAGDEAVFRGDSASIVRCISYFKAATGALVNAATTAVGGTVQLATQANMDAGAASVVPTTDLNKITLGTYTVTTSGASIDFTGIPSGTRRITMSLVGVSTNGTSIPQVQLGDSGGIETTGYLGSASTMTNAIASANATAGAALRQGHAAADVLHGTVTCVLADSATNTWVISGFVGASNSANMSIFAYSKPTSAVLDRIRLTTVNGTDAFDLGSVNITYER